MSSGSSGPKRCTLSSEIGMFKRLSSLNVLVSGLFTAGAGVATTGTSVGMNIAGCSMCASLALW